MEAENTVNIGLLWEFSRWGLVGTIWIWHFKIVPPLIDFSKFLWIVNEYIKTTVSADLMTELDRFC